MVNKALKKDKPIHKYIVLAMGYKDAQYILDGKNPKIKAKLRKLSEPIY